MAKCTEGVKDPVKNECFFMLTEAVYTHVHTHTYNYLRKVGREREWGNSRIGGLMYNRNGTQQ